MTTIPTWDELLDRGLTAPEAARLRGVTPRAAHKAARRRGRAFASGRVYTAERLERRRALFATSEAREVMRQMALTKWDRKGRRIRRKRVRDALSPEDFAAYRACRAKRYTRAEALTMIGHADLVEGTR